MHIVIVTATETRNVKHRNEVIQCHLLICMLATNTITLYHADFVVISMILIEESPPATASR